MSRTIFNARRMYGMSVGLLVVLANSVETSAGPLGWGKRETPRMYAQWAAHRVPIGPVDSHFIGNPPANCWDSPTWLYVQFGPPDRVWAQHQARHLVPVCPGETAPAPWWVPPAISPTPANWGVRFRFVRGGVIHPGPPAHRDNFLEVLGAAYRWGWLGGYSYVSVGFHDPVCESRYGTLTGDQVVPPVPPPPEGSPIPYAVGSIAVDSTLGVFVLCIVAQEIAPQELIGASLHIGPPGLNGPAILDLGPPSLWEDVDGNGIVRVILEEPFPMDFHPEFIAEQMYISLNTVQYPEGAVRGQLYKITTANIKGDLNCDEAVNFKDINPFVQYLSNPSAWQDTHPDCPMENGDINSDGTFPSFKDINPFVALLSQ